MRGNFGAASTACGRLTISPAVINNAPIMNGIGMPISQASTPPTSPIANLTTRLVSVFTTPTPP